MSAAQIVDEGSEIRNGPFPPTDFEQVTEASGSISIDWKEIWRYRELFYFFAWRDIKIKYKQTVLGLLWVVVQPVLMMLIFTIFFGLALRIPSQQLPYPVFVFSGLLIWNTFSAGLSGASTSMINNAAIIKKVYFPRIIIPVSSILVALFDFIFAFLLFGAILLYYRQAVSMHALWCWPLAVAMGVIGTLGPGSLLAALNVKYRDFRYVIPFVLQVMFFVTPVIYPITLLDHDWMRYVIALSPVYCALEIFRFPLTGELSELSYLWVSLGSAIFFLVIGLGYFKRSEDFFADYA